MSKILGRREIPTQSTPNNCSVHAQEGYSSYPVCLSVIL